MRCYRTAGGRYVATQEEARDSGKGWERADIPAETKAGLLAFINGLAERTERLPAPPVHTLPPPPPLCASLESGRPRRDMSAGAVLARIDGGPDVDAICEAIGVAEGYALRRFSGAVAVAFTALSR